MYGSIQTTEFDVFKTLYLETLHKNRNERRHHLKLLQLYLEPLGTSFSMLALVENWFQRNPPPTLSVRGIHWLRTMKIISLTLCKESQKTSRRQHVVIKDGNDPNGTFLSCQIVILLIH